MAIEQVKFTKFKNDNREALALDKVAIDENTKTLSLYSSSNSAIVEEVVLPFANQTTVDDMEADITDFKAEVMGMVGSPLTASTAAEMTDTSKIYVYVGSETGYTNGNWYYYNNSTSAWTSGGVYNSTAFETDTTLSVSGMAADAEATGDELTTLNNQITELMAIRLGTDTDGVFCIITEVE